MNDQNSKQVAVRLNGKLMPFTSEELVEVLRVLKHSTLVAGEKMVEESDAKIMEDLEKDLGKL